jgi:hypothetical protein
MGQGVTTETSVSSTPSVNRDYSIDRYSKDG